jgi:hypothetical protein
MLNMLPRYLSTNKLLSLVVGVIMAEGYTSMSNHPFSMIVFDSTHHHSTNRQYKNQHLPQRSEDVFTIENGKFDAAPLIIATAPLVISLP